VQYQMLHTLLWTMDFFLQQWRHGGGGACCCCCFVVVVSVVVVVVLSLSSLSSLSYVIQLLFFNKTSNVATYESSKSFCVNVCFILLMAGTLSVYR